MSIIEKAAGRIEHGRQERALALARAADSTAGAGPARGDGVGHGAATAAAMPPLPPLPPAPVTSGAPPRRTREVELDLVRMQERGLITVAGGRTLQVEDFRVIKRPILKKAFPGGTAVLPSNLVMITSALAGEGKTYCSINLAMSIAMELDHTVLLIDADVARPSVLKALGLPPQPGLMDLLLDDSLDLADVMLRTNVNTLSILPAGTANLRATELLASQSMKTLVLEIAQRYPDRIIIFDSPPLLLTSEARVLAGHMGQIVMVVESQRTTQHAVMDGLRRLDGCDNVSLIYNKSRDFAGTETYDYHYG
ncbi:chromosome partitioning ATPase [Janthinobacterium sp. BJB412]|nr:chromosome partitioning ATPase [Janthinobacterium sp. BJB412]